VPWFRAPWPDRPQKSMHTLASWYHRCTACTMASGPKRSFSNRFLMVSPHVGVYRQNRVLARCFQVKETFYLALNQTYWFLFDRGRFLSGALAHSLSWWSLSSTELELPIGPMGNQKLSIAEWLKKHLNLNCQTHAACKSMQIWKYHVSITGTTDVTPCTNFGLAAFAVKITPSALRFFWSSKQSHPSSMKRPAPP